MASIIIYSKPLNLYCEANQSSVEPKPAEELAITSCEVCLSHDAVLSKKVDAWHIFQRLASGRDKRVSMLTTCI